MLVRQNIDLGVLSVTTIPAKRFVVGIAEAQDSVITLLIIDKKDLILSYHICG